MDVLEADPDTPNDAAGGGGEAVSAEARVLGPRRGVLHVYARDDDTCVKFISDGLPVTAGRLIEVAFFSTPEDAGAVAAWCADLLTKSNMAASEDGWHLFEAAHLPALLNVARNQLHITYGPPQVEQKADQVQLVSETPDATVQEDCSRAPWPREKLVLLGALVWQGLTAKQIAEDHRIGSTPGAVQKQANRAGLRLREAPRGQVACQLPLPTMVAITRAAAAVDQTPGDFVRRWLVRAAADPARYGMVVITP